MPSAILRAVALSTRTGLALLVAAGVAALASCGGSESELVRTAPGPEVWAVGDSATGSEDATRLGRFIAAQDPDDFIYLGDVYEDGTADEYRTNYGPALGELAAITHPTPGDHEWENRRRGYYPYYNARRLEHLKPWYAVRTGEWELLSLNSEAPHGPGSPQLRWLKKHLQSSRACRIAFWHRPRYHAGERKPEYEDTAPLWDALRGRTSAVLGGDEHNMQRLAPRDGITQFVVGTGGRDLYDVNRDDPRLEFGNDEDFGALKLTLSPGQATFAFVNLEGETLDEGTLPCRGK